MSEHKIIDGVPVVWYERETVGCRLTCDCLMIVQLIVKRAREEFRSGKTRQYEFRKQQLQQFILLFEDHEEEIIEALHKDLHKPRLEAIISEIFLVKNDAITAVNNLKDWMKPEYTETGLLNKMDTSMIISEPLGVALIIGAWNYPIQVTLLPLVGAIAAGNCAVVKPSEVASATAELIKRLLPKYLDRDCYPVVLGGVKETQDLLQLKFDKMFYTGGSAVGKLVMEAAAKNLTRVTLELGGKSPCYVDDECDLATVANRIAWGKFSNSGQTCVAPDYVLCSPGIQAKLIKHLKETIYEFYGEDPRDSADYGRIINDRHFHICILIGREPTDNSNYQCAPAIFQRSGGYLQQLSAKTSLRRSADWLLSIFGPILPIVSVDNVHDAVEFINDSFVLSHPIPIASHPIPSLSHPIPIASHPIPSLSHPIPIASHPIPSLSHPMPIASHPIPSLSHPIPIAPHPIPSLSHPIHIASHPIPSLSHPIPIASRPIPSLSHPIPIASHPIPSLSHPIPIASHPIASLSHPIHIASHPIPSLSHPIPIASRPIPSLSHPIPIASHPIPSLSHPIPIASRPIASLSHPIHIASHPIPSLSHPIPIASRPIPFLSHPIPIASHPIPSLYCIPSHPYCIPSYSIPISSHPYCIPSYSIPISSHAYCIPSYCIPISSHPYCIPSYSIPISSHPIPIASRPIPSLSHPIPIASRPIPSLSHPIPIASRPIPSYLIPSLLHPILFHPYLIPSLLHPFIQLCHLRDKPLALYIFSSNKDNIKYIMENTSSGGFCANDTVVHAAVEALPFGGVGGSGMGAYHGKHSFDSFSHKKGCLLKNLSLESMNAIRYPPYKEQNINWLRFLIVKSVKKEGIAYVPLMLLGVVCALLFKVRIASVSCSNVEETKGEEGGEKGREK
ncbi:hypothetical protein QZH41_018380, partial [Actinostola sp. cb2023]